MTKSKLVSFITLNAKAKEAMLFYAEVLPETKIKRMDFYKDSPDFSDVKEELVLHGALSIKGSEIFFLDMQEKYPAPEPNWAHSIYFECDTEQEFDQVFAALAEAGSVMMGPESVGNIRKCAWITDKFGITWQPVWE